MGRIGAKNLKTLGTACGVEPLATAIDMPPTFKMHALGVFAHEQIGLKILIRGPWTIAFDMRLAPWAKLGFFTFCATIRAFQ